MSKKILEIIADGFEEVEALAPCDFWRRCGFTVDLAALTGDSAVGAHNITVKCDTGVAKINVSDYDMVFLPGGMPGTTNLGNSEILCNLLKECAKKGKLIAALCAAPSVLGKLGLLKGKVYTCYPGFESEDFGGIYKKIPVAESHGDYTVITAWGPGAAFRFGFDIANQITGESVENLKEAMMMCGDE